MLEVYARLCRECADSGRLRPNVITFNTMITAAGRAGEWEKALDLYDDMDEYGVLPDKVRSTHSTRQPHPPACLRAAPRTSVHGVKCARGFPLAAPGGRGGIQLIDEFLWSVSALHSFPVTSSCAMSHAHVTRMCGSSTYARRPRA